MTALWSVTAHGKIIRRTGNPVAMVDTSELALDMVAMLNAQEAGTTAAAQHYEQRLADVRAEFEKQLAIADRRATNAQAHSTQAAETERMCSALRLIDRYGCTRYTRGRCWDGGLTREAQYSDDKWCDACVAADALQGGTR